VRYEQETISNIFCGISRRFIFNKYSFIKTTVKLHRAYLYLGAGIGIGIVFLITKNKDKETYEKITKKDLPNVLEMIVLDKDVAILIKTCYNVNERFEMINYKSKPQRER